jgi:hypothetical protein
MRTVTQFFENLDTNNLTPSDVYAHYLKSLKSSGSTWPKSYMSSALTNGGYGRNKKMDFWKAFTANANLARRVIDALNNNELIGEDDLMFFPGDTKSPEDSWNQLDYNLFFCLSIIGVDSEEEARNIEKFVRENINSEGFTNRSLSFEERKKSYKHLVDLVEEYVKKHNVQVNPVQSIIELLDTELSLGAWMESEIARRFGAKIFRVQINETITSNDEALDDVIRQIKEIRNIDSTFNFFNSVDGNGVKPIYLVEM